MRDALPDLVVQIAEFRLTDPPRVLMWVSGCDFDRFEAAVLADRTVSEYVVLATADDQCLYRLTLSETGANATTYPTIVDQDILVCDAVMKYEATRIRARFPSRDALKAYRDACQQQDISFTLVSLYSDEDGGKPRYGMTPPQRDALVLALEQGYFDVPRSTALTELAEQLGLSKQATSARLRRGTAALVRATLDS
jgi:predicted DNA binding protein